MAAVSESRLAVRIPATLLVIGVIGLAFRPGNLNVRPEQPAGSINNSTQGVTLVLDNVEIVIRADTLPAANFTLPEPGAGSQVATSTSWAPFRELTVTAVPLGHKPGTEAVPAAASGAAAAYLAALRSDRLQQAARVQAGPTATLFGQPVTGIRVFMDLFVDGPVKKPVVIDEWVVEAGSRLWIVRASWEQVSGLASAQSADFTGALNIDSSTLGNPSTIGVHSNSEAMSVPDSWASAGDLPTPAWWNGDCDSTHYTQSPSNPKHIASYRLGAVYLGMAACGPRPWADGAPDVLVRFYPGAWGEYEWECVELVMRFLYLMYGVSPYSANGSQVVWNYSGSVLARVPNGTIGQAPLPNDVLSYGATSTFGHASVVSASNVDSNGNGTISVIEENNSVSGSSTLSVSNWRVSGNAGSVSGWLHVNNGIGGSAPWYGSVAITSDRPLVSVVRSHIGDEVATYDSFAAGSLTSYLPMLFKNAWGSYNSAFYVQNTHAANTAHVTIQYYDTGGTLTCQVTDIISSLSSKGYWVPGVDCLPDGWVGGAVVSSDQPIVTVGRPHVGAEIMTYNGFASGSLTSYLPMLFKNAFGGSYDSAFYVQNTHAANTAHITINYYDTSGNPTCQAADSILPLSSHGYWVPGVDCLPVGWVGGVSLTSDQPIIAVGRVHIGSQVTTYDGFASGSLTASVPMIFKNVDGVDNSAFYIQNIDTVNEAAITLKYYDTGGRLTCATFDAIAPLSSNGYWTPSVGCLPDGWVGSVLVTSDRPIVAVGRAHMGSQVSTYNGFAAGSAITNLPMVFKTMWSSYTSAFYLQNTDLGNAASITMKFYDVNGALTCKRTDTLPPMSALTYWLPAIACSP